MSTAPGAPAPPPVDVAHPEVGGGSAGAAAGPAAAAQPAGATPDAAPPAWVPPSSPRRAIAALAAMSVAGFLFVTNEIAPFGLITLMAEDLGRSESEIGLVVTGFAAVVVVASVPFAIALRRVQRRHVIGGALLVLSVGALVVAVSESFEMLLVGRLISALGQSAFWAVANPTAGALFSPTIRGKVTARMLIGTSAAGVIGLPAVTRMGQLTEWQTPFFVIAGAAALLAVVAWVLIPSYQPDAGVGSRAPQPNARRFAAILAVVTLSAGATALTFTYITPFLVDVTGVAESVVPVLLLCTGLAGVAGILTVGRFLDRYPMRTVAVLLVVLLLAWSVMWVGGAVFWVAFPMLMLQSFAWSCFVAAGVNRILRHAPGSLDVGVASNASMYNLGTVAGSSIGAGMLAAVGAAWLPAASALAAAIAIAVLGFEWHRLAGGAARGGPRLVLVAVRRRVVRRERTS